MQWTQVAATLLALISPPPCRPGDLDRFPRTIWIEEGETVVYRSPRLFVRTPYRECRSTGWECASVERMLWLEANRAAAKPGDWEYWSDQIGEQERINRAWKVLDWAWRYRDFYGQSPLDELETLRRLIGEQAYLSGRMPDLIPTHRYVDVSR